VSGQSPAPGSGVPDCQDCGACCTSPSPGHVPITGDDYARLTPDERERLTDWDGNRCFMRLVGERCVNLLCEQGRFTCAIYERRPQVCRDYEQGGEACAYDRERVGSPPSGRDP
jgi:uncharacterized protein